MKIREACRALYGLFKSGKVTADTQGLMKNTQFKNMSTGLRWNNFDFGVQLRTTFQGHRPNNCSFKVEFKPESLFVKKQVVKPVVVSSQTNYFMSSLKGMPWLLPFSSVIIVVSALRWAYWHVDGDHCDIIMPKIFPSNPFRNKLIQKNPRGKPCMRYFFPTQYMGKKFKDEFLDSCKKSFQPDFKELVYGQKQVEKVLIFADFRDYQDRLSICLTISLTVLSIAVVTPWVRAIRVETVSKVFHKQLGGSYFLQLLIVQYSITVTKVFVEWTGFIGFVLVVGNLELLFWIQKRVILSLNLLKTQLKKVKVNHLLR